MASDLAKEIRSRIADGSWLLAMLRDIGAFPDIPRVMAADSSEGGQDTTGEATLAAIIECFFALAAQVIVEQEFLAQSRADMLPGESLER